MVKQETGTGLGIAGKGFCHPYLCNCQKMGRKTTAYYPLAIEIFGYFLGREMTPRLPFTSFTIHGAILYCVTTVIWDCRARVDFVSYWANSLVPGICLPTASENWLVGC